MNCPVCDGTMTPVKGKDNHWCQACERAYGLREGVWYHLVFIGKGGFQPLSKVAPRIEVTEEEQRHATEH